MTTGSGKMVRAWVVLCRTCPRQSAMFTEGDLLKKYEAEAYAEHQGWKKTEPGWQCPGCQKVHIINVNGGNSDGSDSNRSQARGKTTRGSKRRQ